MRPVAIATPRPCRDGNVVVISGPFATSGSVKVWSSPYVTTPCVEVTSR
jgi:hypothetical protein